LRNGGGAGAVADARTQAGFVEMAAKKTPPKKFMNQALLKKLNRNSIAKTTRSSPWAIR
jgi:hypothetical protein